MMGSVKLVAILGVTLLIAIQHTGVGAEDSAATVAHPSESECRPYIEKALKEKEHPSEAIDETQADEKIRGDADSVEDEATTEGGGSDEDNDSAAVEPEAPSDNEPNDLVDDTVDTKASTVPSSTPNEDNHDSGEENSIEETQDKSDTSLEIGNNSAEAAENSSHEEIANLSSDEKKGEEVVNDTVSVVEASADKNNVEDSSVEKEVENAKSEEVDKESGEVEVENAEKTSIEEIEDNQSTEDVKFETNQTEPSTVNKDDSVEENKEEANEPEVIKGTTEGENATPDVLESENKTESENLSKETEEEDKSSPEEDLTLEIFIPDNLRDRTHVHEILKLDEKYKEEEELLGKTIDTTLKELKRLYDNAIKPLEILYKYRDLSNRHFGDPEIFSKPLVLFMGPWSGGKSSILNYLLDNEYTQNSLRTGAEPSPAYFNILSWGESPTILDGTQLAADWTFSGLQKFGQGLLDRLRGLQLPHPLLEKINLVEIPGILEIRKQVERQFPFNDACQWFIDRADIIFLVYDPSKLDVGPETEAILDQLKGREYQTRIILNKADQVKPEELMRVQGTLIWNISPLMSSSEPPVMYSTSLWSNPYEIGAPIRLLQAQEYAFLKDLRYAIDKRVENKIASARRFAVRVRNHAKMVDCYLTTYYNHKTFFGNKKKIADDIIEHPQNYHIYAGLSTLTNISRYDLPDPEVYRDFFRLNPVFEFKKLSDTCTYFRGCPINRLDVAIAYDLPELVGKYKKSAETLLKQYSDNKAKQSGSS